MNHRLPPFKVSWKVIEATPAELDAVKAVIKENPTQYEYTTDAFWTNDQGTDITKLTVRASSIEWLHHLWHEMMKAYWSAEMLNSALRLQQAIHPELAAD